MKLTDKIDQYLNETAQEYAVVQKEPEGYYVYPSREHAQEQLHNYALKPKKSLGQALFAANDEQGYTHYRMMNYSLTPPIEPLKKIPAKFLDSDKYMVD